LFDIIMQYNASTSPKDLLAISIVYFFLSWHHCVCYDVNIVDISWYADGTALHLYHVLYCCYLRVYDL